MGYLAVIGFIVVLAVFGVLLYGRIGSPRRRP
jgi:hypothetical protein